MVFVRRVKLTTSFFDDREDTTKVILKADNSDPQLTNIITEQHYSVCIELGGRYPYHFAPEKGSMRKSQLKLLLIIL